jgi:hypothetical protein
MHGVALDEFAGGAGMKILLSVQSTQMLVPNTKVLNQLINGLAVCREIKYEPKTPGLQDYQEVAGGRVVFRMEMVDDDKVAEKKTTRIAGTKTGAVGDVLRHFDSKLTS